MAVAPQEKKQIRLYPKLSGYGDKGERRFNESEVIRLSATEYILKLGGICSSCNINTRT